MKHWLDEQIVHILVADDEPQNLRILTEFLSDNWVVHAFSGGVSLLRYLDKGKSADLIMLDVMMPDMDGYAVCEQIRSRPALQDVPVVFLTSLDSVADEARGLSLGAVDFIIKPFSPLVVLARLRNHVRLGLATRFMQQQNEILEAKVDERTRTLTAILEASPVGIVTLDHGGMVLTCNPAAESIIGRPAASFLGSPVQEVLTEAPAFVRCLQDVATGNSIRGVERSWKRADGSAVTVRGSAAPLLDDGGEYRGAVIVLENVSERRHVEDQLHQARKMEAIGRLTGGLAHDFNNLLTVVIGNLDLMDKMLPEESPAREMMENALNGSLRGANLTQQLLAFSRKQPLQPDLVDVNLLIRGTAKLLSRTLGEAIAIKVVESMGLWPVLADRSQLDIAILNLSANARDAMPKGGALTISTSARTVTADRIEAGVEITAGDYVVIEVSDTGTGMPPEVMSHMFEPFFTTKAVNKGTGIGLATVYGFIKQSGGYITASSEVGRGSTIRLYLPRATETGNAARPIVAEAAQPAANGGETILVVEDNVFIRKMVVHQLTNSGYTVLAAESAAQGLGVLESGAPVHLLFSDIVMPGEMTGLDLARTAKSRWPDIKILLTTGFLDAPLLRESAALGSVVLTKPYRQTELNRKLSQALTG